MARAALRRRLTWQTATVLAVEHETTRARRLHLELPDWPGHDPGQHVDIRLTAPDGYTAQRSYSIASAPETPHLELVIERLPDGEVSTYLTQELRAGDDLELRGPIGGYFIWHTGLPGPLQMVAGGSGVVPFLAMLDHHAAAESTLPARLLYSARSVDDVIARERLAQTQPGVDVTLALTRAAPDGWTGLTSRIDKAALSQHSFAPDSEPHVFVCGPTSFVEAVTSALIELGHPPTRIKTERFGTSGGNP
jgi:ferredoxin-NADP reductase